MQLISFGPTEKKFHHSFIEFPFKLYEKTPQWVPPLRIDQRSVFDTQKHAFYQSGDAHFFMVRDHAGEIVARLAVMENRRYNKYFHTQAAFFYLFDCVNDFSVAEMLFKAGFEWAKSRGLTSIIGPKGFSVFDGFGILVQGYEHPAAYGQIYNMPYYQEFLKKLGFEKLWDTFTGYMHRTAQFPEKIFQAADLVQRKRGFHIRKFKSKNELKAAVDDIQMLYNASLAGDARNISVSDAEMQTMVNQLLKFADPHLIKLIYKEENRQVFYWHSPTLLLPYNAPGVICCHLAGSQFSGSSKTHPVLI